MSDDNYYLQLGWAATAMMKSDLYCRYPVACLDLWIRPAIQLGQIRFFFDRAGGLRGYVTWAFLSAEGEHRLLNDPEVILHLSEWNEGNRLWLLDFVVLGEKPRRRIRETMHLFACVDKAKSLRRDADGRVRKVTVWKHRHFPAP
ncbi:toxin-activating lysine-acyltransferase [Tahibacter soli]|uniref:RTX toxin-activating lysine-acyltransferase n=1 Tax=Tahibacter soli TaxID=2983605 RepID=A0A9X3YP52_9GAMM|nr:toxin-activating lysine-acyltransferase [Tahibacter soli]MDC8014885.1 toxin-activating lysine-acyltransferase [Tahibacter soli]